MVELTDKEVTCMMAFDGIGARICDLTEEMVSRVSRSDSPFVSSKSELLKKVSTLDRMRAKINAECLDEMRRNDEMRGIISRKPAVL